MIQPEDAVERWNNAVVTEAVMMEDERFENVELDDDAHVWDVWAEFCGMMGGATMAMVQVYPTKEHFVIFRLPLVYEVDDE